MLGAAWSAAPLCKLAKRRCQMALTLLLSVPFMGTGGMLPGEGSTPPSPQSGDPATDRFEHQVREFFDALPPLEHHYVRDGGNNESGTTSGVHQDRAETERRRYRQIVREKVAGAWFAALVSTDSGNLNEIQGRFETWKGLQDFIVQHEAVVDLWAYGDRGERNARRVPAWEVAEMRKEADEQPLFVSLTYRDPNSGTAVTQRIEFAFNAAAVALEGQQAYSVQRQLQATARRILSARELGAKFSSAAQWKALQEAIRDEGFQILDMPLKEGETNGLFVAVEYEVNQANYPARVVRLWRENEILPRVVREPDATYVQVLQLRTGKTSREVRAFQIEGVTDQLKPVRSPLLGQDSIELRVMPAAGQTVQPRTADPRTWNLLEFGEPALVRQAAIAEFSLINAYLEKHRKEIGLIRSKFDLFAEPVFAGLNIGCGLAGVGFPVGAAARLGYNAAITPWLIPPVPNVKQMRDLMRLVAAREKLPGLKTKPARFLDAADFHLLKRQAATISEAELDSYLQRIQDEDIQAMLRLARMAKLDAEITNLLNILAESAKVSGWSDEPGLQRDLLNSIYFSVNGDINIKNIIAVLAGARNTTPYAGISLHDLAHGGEPQIAWLQFLDGTVDVRAVANTISRLMHSDRAKKELKMPFPYATRMSDIAAYEIRIFGYPLLMYYKRGLLKKDYSAYENDYAYGLITTRIVEHFRTREEMEGEIRAGRMMPLGFVKVPDVKGGWKDSNLAVFAHRIPTGKHAGKTAIIIYGLKAYAEQSRLMQREYQRLKKFEQALREGGVIEQIVEAEAGPGALLPDPGFEPVIHVGTNATTELFSPLLGNLLESRRFVRRSAWGLEASPSETNAWAEVRRVLELHGVCVDLAAKDPLLGVDRFSSSFLYRKKVNGRWCTVKMVNIPSPNDMARELRKAEQAFEVESLRRRAVSEDGQGIALLSRVKWVKDTEPGSSRLKPELGPLLRDSRGNLVGFGVRPDAEALNNLFEQVGRLPIIERAKLQSRDFSASMVELDVGGDGSKQQVFLTVEFPVNEEFQRTSTNTLTGEKETHVFRNGRLCRSIGPRRIIELDYEQDAEAASRTFLNQGTLAAPVKGALLEETKTLEVWHRDLRDGPIDPYQPSLSKVHANYVTGAVTREEFGLFAQPVWTADDLYVVSNQFNAFGIFARALVWENISDTTRDPSSLQLTDAVENRWTALLRPATGKPRFEITSRLPSAELQALTDGRSTGYRTVVRKLDLVKGTSRIQTFDNSAAGRLENESWSDTLAEQADFPWFSHQNASVLEATPRDSAHFEFRHLGLPVVNTPNPPLPGALSVTVRREYRESFCFGMVPFATRKTVGTGDELLRTRTLSYSPLTRRLLASEQDYTGASRRKLWDYRWDSPVIIEAAGRRTEIVFNREETLQTSTTVIASNGEELAVSSGAYDSFRAVWQIGRTYWYRPGITNRVVTETRTGFGLLLASQTADLYLAQPLYESDGIERTACVFRRDPVSGKFDLFHRLEEDYFWWQGRRLAQVQTYADGRPYDRFWVVGDEMGRTTEEGIRKYPEVQCLTRLTYDGDSERIARAEELQNGRVRVIRLPQREEPKPTDSSPVIRWELPVRVQPQWGLISTQVFVLGDPLGRAVREEFENGDQVQVREWYPESAIARVSELVKPGGRVVERTVTTLSSGTNGSLPYDLTERYRVSFWGGTGLAAREASVRGTDLDLFVDVADERIFFDLRQPFKTPSYALDPHGYIGVAASVAGLRHSNVCALFRAQLEPTGSAGSASNGRTAGPHTPGEVLRVERADLRGLFFHRITERKYDRSGRLLEEVVSRAPNAGAACYRNETVFDVPRTSLARFKPEYQPGWFVEARPGANPEPRASAPNEPQSRWLFFTNQPPPAGSRGYRVNDGTFPDTITMTEGKVFGSTGESEAAKFRDFFYRRIHSLRFLERNPHMPGATDYWSASTRSDFGQDGTHLFDLELVFDAQGRLRVARADKSTSSGAPGTRISYGVVEPGPENLRTSVCPPGRNSSVLETSGRTDFTRSDFLYLYAWGAPDPQLVVQDGSGRTAIVQRRDSGFRAGLVPVWRSHPMHVRWLPDDVEPRQGTDLSSPAWLQRSGYLLPVSVHDLVRARLNVGDLRSFQLHFTNQNPVRISISPLFALDRDGRFVKDSNRREYSVAEIDHSSGLRSVVTIDRARTERDFYSGQKTDVLVEFNGLPVATARTRGSLADFPNLLWLDNSDPDVARPLYTISGRDGHFLEYYQMLRPGDTHLYVAPQSFEVPRLETYRAGVLHDELYAGHTGYGRDYRLKIPITRASGLAGKLQATLRNRVEANLFRFAADQVLDRVPLQKGGEGLKRFDYLRFQQAETRAREIKQQPSAAQMLVDLHDVPWRDPGKEGVTDVPVNWERLRARLLRRRMTAQGLIPTSPYTEAARFVDTVKEADVIVLAVKLGQPKIAAELLDFYRRTSRGGRQFLLSSYDAETGTSMERDVRSRRPGQSQATAEAQLAIAEAAFCLALESRAPANLDGRNGGASPVENRTITTEEWIIFGRNLLALTLQQFRPEDKTGVQPRGICEYRVHPVHGIMGLNIWPDANIYSLASNARAYLLLKRLDQIARSRFQDPEWELQLSNALREQEDFLKLQILPEVERTGVVPAGLFEIQDIEQQTTAIAIERWTTAEDWLRFLEAAAEMGVDLEKCRGWLENLARVHGVQVGTVWGLDWRLALLREDAISTELTARYLRVAKRLGHRPAQAFAARNLQAIRWNVHDLFPTAVTEAPPEHALAGSRDFSVLPWANVNGWPPSISIFRDLWESQELERKAAPVTAEPASIRLQLDRASLHTSEPPHGPRPLHQLASRMGVPLDPTPQQKTDLTVFVLITAGVYGSVLGSALFWWALRTLRRRHNPSPFTDQLVADRVMELAEERWAKRVLGLRTTSDAECWRFSNAPVEQNFLVQLRAAYKLILEWRRLENGWAQDDERLVECTNDSWVNGADEFAALVGIYMRAVIKAGAKDGFSKHDALAENEDSNHIWARMTLFFSEHLWSLEASVGGWQKARGGPAQEDYRAEIEQTLQAMGIRERLFAFDARELFDFPANPHALDLLIIQDPKRSLSDTMSEVALKLDIPLEHIRAVVEQYKLFKNREQPYPIHPYLVEAAKELPHFVLMALGAIVAYNQRVGDSPIVEYLKSMVTSLLLAPESLLWAVPLLGGLTLTLMARFLRVYRFEAAIRPRHKPAFLLDSTVTSIFVKRHEAEPKQRTGPWRDPNTYERWGWVLRAAGYLILAVSLFRLETPSFGTFLIVKGIFAMLALLEVAAVLLPLAGTALSMWIQDGAPLHPALARLNRLNITATRPASPIWLSIKYHAQPSMPTGTRLGLIQAIVFYFVLAAAFFFGAGFLCQQIFSLWFTETYLHASNLKLLIGGVVFALTMVLMRYGLFLLFTSIASIVAVFPLLCLAGFAGVAQLVLTYFGPGLELDMSRFAPACWGLVALIIGYALFGKRNSRNSRDSLRSGLRTPQGNPKAGAAENEGRLAVVYMSGDDVSALKLTPELLMTRWSLLRDRLDSSVVPILAELAGKPDDQTLKGWFQELYQAEQAAGVTLWHPVQLRLAGADPAIPDSPKEAGTPARKNVFLPPELGLHLTVSDEQQRRNLTVAWHIRRWLVCMMSTAGHSQDTGINLVDMALRFDQDGLGGRVVFYLIQNKYDNSPNNRPSQINYAHGEMGQRNKLARLLCALAPGTRAYCLQNWTPFGFKAGGLTGMDLVYEESLRLSSMLLLDRNATVHDLDALMEDVREAMADPNLIIVIPGRSTTNTLTPLGQGSQLVEEGHRSFLRGLLSFLGGTASEAVGTGWGNLLACFYGRVQRALVSAGGRKMALTSRMLRGTSFAERTEGLIGFGPHAVGISEDIWAVVQAMNTALGLGLRPRFALSHARWHKVRETWSHAEWLSSFPRWAGGYFQMVHDPLMQRIYDFGPQSVFARELRSNSGRNFLSAPIALLNILLMPLSIIFDVSPFVQTLVVLWNCGFVLNQVLTLHALNMYLESCGFYRLTALAGAAVAGGFLWHSPWLHSYGPGLVLLGFVLGGFFVGFGRWLVTRVRDLVLFGPQLVLHAMAQMVRLSLEFTVSGTSAEDARHVNIGFRGWAGPREDRPLERFPSCLNLRTVIWSVGICSLLLCLLALTRLDMLNVLLLLPSLLFSVSTVAGPFLLSPTPGKPLGLCSIIPRGLGWVTAALFYTVVSVSASKGPAGRWVAVGLFVLMFGLLLRRALRYVGFRYSINRNMQLLRKIIGGNGLQPMLNGSQDAVQNFPEAILQSCANAPSTMEALLQKIALTPEQRQQVNELLQARMAPLLRSPVTHLRTGLLARSRWAVEYSRALVLGLLVLLWFFLVPVPGLMVFTAGSYPESYRFALPLEKILLVIAGGITLVLSAYWVGRAIQWLDLRGRRGASLQARLERCFARASSQLTSTLLQVRTTGFSGLTHAQAASAFALITDAQTYIDQRSYAFARRAIERTESILTDAER